MNLLENTKLYLKNNINFINMFLKCIERSCNILQLEIPSVYFIYQDKSNFFLFDQNLNYISSDYHDVDQNIHFMKFIKKEYVIYVNCYAIKNPTLLIAKGYELVRHMYQLKMISYFDNIDKNIKDGQTSENNKDIRKLENSKRLQRVKLHIRSWKYCYENINNKNNINGKSGKSNKNSKNTNNTNNYATLIQVDMMAFSHIMMKKYHHINIEYKIDNKEDLLKAIDFISNTIF